jgi:UDP-glucuronate decarboxylase
MIETEILTENANEILERVDLSKMEGKSILVTGSSGIIGLYILYSLYLFKKRFHIPIEVTGVVYNELPSYLEFLKQSGFKFMRGNLADASFSAKLPNADIIVHAATYGQPGQYLIDKIGTLRLNTSLTLDLLEKVNSGGSFLFMSSSSVYIGLTHVPFNENEIGISNTNHYRSCYIEGKRCGEAICEAYKDKGINAKSVRLSLAYGPGTKIDDKRVLYDFIRKGLTSGEIRLLDSGRAKRTYCFISDAVSMILNILIFGKESIYNVGGVSDTTIAEIGKMIGEKLDVPVIIPKDSEDSIISKGAPIDDKLDLGRYVGEFGDVNFISLDEGLDRTIRWQKEIFKRK